MPDQTTALPPKIEFLDFHHPKLAAGDYKITVRQEIVNSEKITANNSFTTNKSSQPMTFEVRGDRIKLNPQHVLGVYPAPGSAGDHANVLPQVVFNRSTLPWERSAATDTENVPWLALLLFEENEKLSGQVAKKDFVAKFDKRFPGSHGAAVWGILIYDKETVDEQSVLEEVVFQWIKPTNMAKDIGVVLSVTDAKRQALDHKLASQNLPFRSTDIEPILDMYRGPHVMKWSDLKASTTGVKLVNDIFEAAHFESWQQNDDPVTVLDVPYPLLKDLIPRQNELNYLSHVRQGVDLDGASEGAELSFVVGNRVACKGKISHAWLVSLERTYTGNAFQAFSGISGSGQDIILRFICLKDWRYACANEMSFEISKATMTALQALKVTNTALKTNLAFAAMLTKLTTASSKPYKALFKKQIVGEEMLRYQLETQFNTLAKTAGFAEAIDTIVHNARNKKLSFKGLLTHLDRAPSTLSLPPVPNNAQANAYRANGYALLPHHQRQQSKTVSWYRGPLVPGSNLRTKMFTLPAQTADELVHFNPTTGLFDTTYAAAWELGRLLTLENRGVSANLFGWKRRRSQLLQQTEKQLLFPHLAAAGKIVHVDLPLDVGNWFQDLRLLRGLPFNYIVPEEAMLPRESIRFFQVDPRWIDCLLDGAFSIGRVITADYLKDQSLSLAGLSGNTEQMSGFLLRSEAVAGWPDMQVDGYEANMWSSTTAACEASSADHLFDVPDMPAYEAELKGKGVGSDLAAAFTKAGHQLSTLVTVIVESSDSWIVQDEGNEIAYRVAKHLPAKSHFYVLRVCRAHLLKRLRLERLSNNVLIALFAGTVKSVRIHQKAETLHFGFDWQDDGQFLFKQLKDQNGKEDSSKSLAAIPWRNAAAQIVNISQTTGGQGLFEKVKKLNSVPNSFTTADFALQMIEGVEALHFNQGSEPRQG